MTASAPHRHVRIPRMLRMVSGIEAACEALVELAAERGGSVSLVHSGAASATGYGSALAGRLAVAGVTVREVVVTTNDEPSVEAVREAVLRDRAELVVGVGGGRLVDVAKLAAARSGVDFVSAPTQAASDGICSPVAVILDGAGVPRSVGAGIPIGIVVDMDVLRSAPVATWLSGLGDLVSNLSAVRDWRLAHSVVGEPIDDFACLTAEAAAGSVVDDDATLDDADYRATLVRGLILSGIAMEMSGSSRPASGSEHLISHALDALLPVRRAHGLQVALGTIAAYVLRDEPCERLVAFYRRVGLPVVPGDLGIDVETFMEAVTHGRATRPGRWTALDRLTPADIGRLRDAYATAGRGVW
jgi:glycerol-1-phosphate dehydrogenase [NAD(P)+]